MKNLKSSFFYIVIIGGFSLLIYWIINHGAFMEEGRHVENMGSNLSNWEEFLSSMLHNLQHPLAFLLVQIIVIILVARLFGWLFKKIGQSSVIGKFIAGIAFWSYFLGFSFSDFSSGLF